MWNLLTPSHILLFVRKVINYNEIKYKKTWYDDTRGSDDFPSIIFQLAKFIVILTEKSMIK